MRWSIDFYLLKILMGFKQKWEMTLFIKAFLCYHISYFIKGKNNEKNG